MCTVNSCKTSACTCCRSMMCCCCVRWERPPQTHPQGTLWLCMMTPDGTVRGSGRGVGLCVMVRCDLSRGVAWHCGTRYTCWVKLQLPGAATFCAGVCYVPPASSTEWAGCRTLERAFADIRNELEWVMGDGTGPCAAGWGLEC